MTWSVTITGHAEAGEDNERLEREVASELSYALSRLTEDHGLLSAQLSGFSGVHNLMSKEDPNA